MRTLNTENFYSFNEVAKMLNISYATLYRYFDWWKNPNFEKPDDPEFCLPEVHYLDRARKRFIRKEDFQVVVRFRELLNLKYRGALSRYHAAQSWGKRGKDLMERRGLDVIQEKGKLLY